jgi:hypothetical protein
LKPQKLKQRASDNFNLLPFIADKQAQITAKIGFDFIWYTYRFDSSLIDPSKYPIIALLGYYLSIFNTGIMR